MRIMMAVLTAFSVMASGSVLAWGNEGHEAVAIVAEAYLTPAATAQVHRLLSLDGASTLDQVSTWADEHRTADTAHWHFNNFPRGDCSYDPARDCPNGQCAVAAIQRQSAILASNASDPDRLAALRYVVHIVGDIHQPLHAGYKDDAGANGYQLQAFGRGTNLHAVWDSGLIYSMERNPSRLADALLRYARGKAPATDTDPVVWAEESCRIVGLPGFYPPTHVLPEDYVDQWRPTLGTRLLLAGQRLAAVLNQSLR